MSFNPGNVGRNKHYGVYKIVSVGDKHRAGWYQCKNMHTEANIPDDKCSWFQGVRHSAGHQGLGESPNRYVKGDLVHVNTLDSQMGDSGVIVGSMSSVGLPKKMDKTNVDGVPPDQIDETYAAWHSLSGYDGSYYGKYNPHIRTQRADSHGRDKEDVPNPTEWSLVS